MYPDGVFLSMTQLPRAKRLGQFTAQLNIMEKIYTAALYGREGKAARMILHSGYLCFPALLFV